MRALTRCQKAVKGRRCYLLPVESWGALGRKQVALRPGLEGWKQKGRKLLAVRWPRCGQDRGRQHGFVEREERCPVWPGCDLREGKLQERRRQPASESCQGWVAGVGLSEHLQGRFSVRNTTAQIETLEKDDLAGYWDSFPSSTFWTHTCIWRSLQCKLCWIRYKSLQEGRVKKKKGNYKKYSRGTHDPWNHMSWHWHRRESKSNKNGPPPPALHCGTWERDTVSSNNTPRPPLRHENIYSAGAFAMGLRVFLANI